MIVCNLCGQAISGLGDSCLKCSGKGIERDSPFKSLLTPTQRRGSPDRWAQSYTTPPGQSNGSPLVRDASHIVTAKSESTSSEPRHLDIQPTPGAELARVYGSLLDKTETHPFCAACGLKLVAGRKIYLPPRQTKPSSDAYCRPCYGVRYKMGDCQACSAPIIGDEEEPHKGGHVRGRGESMWHAGCFKCETCDFDLYKQEHFLAISGCPRCPSCYNQVETRSSAKPLESLRRYAPPGSVLPQPRRTLNVPPRTCAAPDSHTIVVDKATLPPSRANYRSSVQYLAKRFEQTEF